jgi:hypothetical protein
VPSPPGTGHSHGKTSLSVQKPKRNSNNPFFGKGGDSCDVEMTAAVNVNDDRENVTATWAKFKDSASGHDYFYNKDTGESKWDVLAVEGDEDPEVHDDDGEDVWLEWEKVYDEVSERWYMFNHATKESLWI